MIDKISDILCFLFEILDLIAGVIVSVVIGLGVLFVLIGVVFAGFQYSTSLGIVLSIFAAAFVWKIARM